MATQADKIPSLDQGKKKQILVVDDDNITRLMINKVLSKSGYEIIEAINGKEALNFLVNNSPDLILLDVMMPGMDGYEVCTEIRKQLDDDSLPIIMLTGLEDIASIEKSFEVGGSDFITKPISWPLLSQRIKYVLRSKDIYQQFIEKERQLLYAQNIAKLGYWGIELNTSTLTLTQEAAKIFGVRDDVTRFEGLFVHVDGTEREQLQSQIQQAINTRQAYVATHKVVLNDDERIISHHGDVVEKTPGEYCLAVTIQDITERVRNEELIRYKTFHDDLTELPNRLYFNDQFMRNIKDTIAQEKLLSIMFIGLDRFKKINDSLGHMAGDQVLRSLALRLSAYDYPGLFISRYDSDVFAVQIPNVSSIEDIELHVEKFQSLLAEPLIMMGTELYMSASIGISIFPLDGEKIDELLKHADMAMHAASKDGGNQYQFSTRGEDEQALKHLTLEREIRKAIKAFQFEVYYQPQINARTMAVVGAEALLRWIHPEQGFISPDEFIPVAEEVGLINPIGMYVLESVCETLAKWNENGLGKFRVGINLSAAQFRDEDLVAFVRTLILVMNLKPEQLELEITERIAVSNFEKSVAVLNQLKEIGVKTSMDDFGTGYSSLSYIQDLPIDTLKIDRAFVKDINDAGDHGEIAKAVINMCASMGIHTIAEGVETDAQYQHLKFNGVDEIQGWYFAKAMPVKEFEAFVYEHNEKYGLTAPA
ncbi:MAG: EAL domain-containing protein [Gammaproteobacteria bacterium]|nr:EAL domain-containing protein [Gammaproteobacteria bacterium]